MELISVEEYQKNIQPALMKVFKDCIFPGGGSISLPFQDSIEGRAFLFGHADKPFHENLIFWDTLSSAIIENGDTEIFCVDNFHLYACKYNLLSEKLLPDLYSANEVICSLQGNWGLLFDFDGLSLLGGSIDFINKIRKSFPEIDQQINYFFEYEKKEIEWAIENKLYTNDPISCIPFWLTDTLIHIYGEERAKELLEDARKMGIYFSTF
jgi:hypothetical protein